MDPIPQNKNRKSKMKGRNIKKKVDILKLTGLLIDVFDDPVLCLLKHA